MAVAQIAEAYLTAVALLAIVNLSLCVFLWIVRRTPGSFVAGCIALAAAEVCLMFHLLTNATNPEAGFMYARLRFLGLALINPLLLIFLLQYTRQTQWLKPGIVAALFAIPVLTQLVLWFTPSNETFFGGWQMVRIAGYTFEDRTLGGWYYVHAYYGGMLLILGLALLGWYTRRVDSARRNELYVMIVLALLATFGVANYVTLGPAPGLKTTPLALGIATIGLIWLLLGGSTQRVMPVAYDLVFSSINDAVLVLDPEKRVVKANPAAEHLFKRTQAEMLAQPVDTLMRPVAGWTGRPDDTAPHTVTIETGTAPLVCEVRYLPLLRGQHEIGGLVMIRDVTAQQQALELRLERERSQVVANFIADASHEFRTPLSVIKSSAYLLGRQADPKSGQRHVAKINDHVDRINTLVNDLQVMAALDSKRPLDSEPLDLRQIVREAADGYALKLTEARKQTMHVTIETGLPIPKGSHSEMVLAVQKVLDNAIRYTPESGTITVTLAPVGTGAEIVVKDTGVGMDEETALAAVQRFYRLDSARSTSGFGLGLPIAQRIMERHGGTLTIQSAPGKGTTVTLTLA